MKRKTIFFVFALICFAFAVPTFAKEEKSLQEENQISSEEQALSESWKNTLNDTGRYLKKKSKNAGEKLEQAGKQLKSDLQESLKSFKEVKCKGTWVHQGESIKTVIEINDDGTMQISRKKGLEVEYFKGTYSGNSFSISFYGTEVGHKNFFKKDSKKYSYDCFITYSILDDSATQARFIIRGIGPDADLLNLGNGVIFLKKIN